MQKITIIILTHNENLHLERCIKSLIPFSKNIFIVDSFSNDNTLEIANRLGAEVKQNNWVNYAKQFNWGLENFTFKTEWVMRMDADEYVTNELTQEINNKLESLSENVTGIILKRRVYFMNRWIRHGGYYPTYLLRIWRNGKGRCEERWMDEHIKLTEGVTVNFDNDIVDDNLNNLTWWTNKHNNYATREAIDLLNIKYKFSATVGIDANLSEAQDKRKRWLKENLYAFIPLFLRPFLYFIYRYIFKLGFLDGIPGLIWHFLQGFWYRFLVDAKVYDIQRRAKRESKSISEIIKSNYGIDV
jgi:glycosyltransferase involved in cell wall biosynthesis